MPSSWCCSSSVSALTHLSWCIGFSRRSGEQEGQRSGKSVVGSARDEGCYGAVKGANALDDGPGHRHDGREDVIRKT